MTQNEASAKKAKPLCFVVGPIGKAGTNERKHADLLLHSVVKHVLQAPEFGYLVKRADEDADPGMIGDRVITDIIDADLVIADLTDLNANAFYELGIRHSTEKPTIHIAKLGTDLPFDNVSHRTIFVDLSDWASTEHARSRLAESARSVSAPGYKVSNPITQANASFKMRQSTDTKDQMLSSIQDRLASIENDLSRSNPATPVTSDHDKAMPEILAFVRELSQKKIPLTEINRRAKLKGHQLGVRINSVEIKDKEIGVDTEQAYWTIPLKW